jgi:outer membrane protein insertion porin family
MHNMSVKYAGGILGGDAAFTKLDAATNFYFALPYSTSIHYKLAGGWAFANGESKKLPVFEKYYLGGINTIRGFKSGTISPLDPVTNEKIGGGKMWYTNLEWIFPLVEEAGLKGVVFLDAGNVYDTDDNWDFSDFKKTAGFGFRWLSPMGPLRLEWGYNLDKKENEIQNNWDFSIGGSF